MGSDRLPRAMPASSLDMVSFASPPTEVEATGGPAASTPELPPPVLSPRRQSPPFRSRKSFKMEPGAWPQALPFDITSREWEMEEKKHKDE